MKPHVTEWIPAYYDGELRGARLGQVEAHLEGCTDCRAELEQLRRLSVLLGEAAEVPARLEPGVFTAQVNARLTPPAARPA